MTDDEDVLVLAGGMELAAPDQVSSELVQFSCFAGELTKKCFTI